MKNTLEPNSANNPRTTPDVKAGADLAIKRKPVRTAKPQWLEEESEAAAQALSLDKLAQEDVWPQDRMPDQEQLIAQAPASASGGADRIESSAAPAQAGGGLMVSAWQNAMQQWMAQMPSDAFKALGLFGAGAWVVHRSSDRTPVPVDVPAPPNPPVIEPPSPPVPPSVSGGSAIDGYLAHALVWHDNNENGRWDADEPYSFTDASGAYIDLVAGDGTLRVTGLTPALRAQLSNEPNQASIDISTGLAFSGVLSAPGGSSVITPLTTLVVATDGDADKLKVLKVALGIPASLELTSFDPLAAMANSNANAESLAVALGAQAAAIKVSNLMAMASSTLNSGGASFDLSAVVSGVAASLVDAAVQAAQSGGSSGSFLDNPSVLQGALAAAVTAAVDSGSDISAGTLATLNAAAQSAASALAAINTSMSTSLATVISSGNLSVGAALNSLTDAVATQLVVLNQLVSSVSSAVTQAVESGVVLDPSALSTQFAQQFSPEALARQIEQAKSEVKTVVVVEQGQTILVAADDFSSVTFDAQSGRWANKAGNLLTNDLSGGAAKTVSAAGVGDLSNMAGESISIQGTYGTLILRSDGQFSYAVDQGAVRAQSVSAKTAVQLKDVFEYQVQSGEKSDLAQLTVNIPLNPVQITDSDAAVNTISENTAAGTVVSGLSLVAADVDTTDITLTLTNTAGGLFALVDNRIVLAAGKALNFEAKADHVVTVQATSADGSTTSQNINIRVLDANDPVQGVLLYSTSENAFKAGQAITANTSGLSDEDGLTQVVYAYQWQKRIDGEWVNMAEAKAAVLTPSVEGLYRVLVSFNDAKGNAESVTGGELTVAPAGSDNLAPEFLEDYEYSWPENLPQVFVLTVEQLVQGFTDPDGDPLGVANLKATGAAVTPVLVDGNVTAYQFIASGAGGATVALSYDVVDGRGGLVPVAQSVTYNAAPVLTTPIADQSLVAGQVLDMASVASSFTDADPLTYLAWQVGQDGQLQALPSWLVFDGQSFKLSTNAQHLGTTRVRVLASDGINPAVSDDFNINVTPVSGKGMLSSLGATLQVFADTTNDNVVNYQTPLPSALTGDFNSGVLTFANTQVFLPRGSLLALTDGKSETTSGTPTLSLPLANVPQLSTPQNANLRITFTAGTDTVATGEAQVAVDLLVTYSSVNGQLVIGAKNQTAQVSVVNGRGTFNQSIDLSFTTADVLAATTVQDGQAYLQLNVLSLLTKLDGGLGTFLDTALNNGNYTLGFEATGGNAALPLTDSLGVPISAIQVGLPIRSDSPNQPPALVFLDELAGDTQLLVATGVKSSFALGQFLLGQDILAQAENPQFALEDADGSVAHVWVFKPVYGDLQLNGNDVNFTLLGAEEFIRLSLTDLAKLEYLPPAQRPNDPSFKQDVLIRFLLEDNNNTLSIFNSLTIGLDASMDRPIGFVVGGQAVSLESGLPLESDAYVQSLPAAELGKVQYKNPGSDVFLDAKVGDTLMAGSLLQFVPAAGIPGEKVNGQLRLVFFDGVGFSFKVIELGSRLQDNRAPQLESDATVDVAENSTLVGVFKAADLDGDAITYHLDADSAKIFAINAAGELSFKQAPDYEALESKTFTVVITASDGSLIDTQTVTVNVVNVNEGITGITLSGNLSVDENTVVVTEIGKVNLALDAAVDPNQFELVVTDPSSPFEVVGDLENGFALQLKAGQNLDHENKASYEVTLRATDNSFEPPTVLDKKFTIAVNNLADTPALSHDVLTLLDGGQETALLGTVSGKTLRFEMLEGQGLDRNNLLALLDGDPQSGVSPVLQFSLASLAGVVPGQTVPQNLQVGVDVQLTSERAGGLPLRASFDLELALTKTNNGLQMAVVAQPVDMDLWVGNRKLGTLTAVNLDADTVMLQSGDNATPQLSVKLDNLLTKAMDNWVSLQALDPAAAVTLVGGVLTQALQGASVLDVLKLAQSIVTLPTGLQDLQLDEFLALGRSVIDLPEGLPAPLQSLSMGDALGLALQIGQLPAGATLGALIALARDAVALPDRLQSATLGDLKAYVLAQLPNNSRAEDVMDRLEALARDVLGLDANVNVGSKTLTELITKLENDFGDLSLADAAGLSGALQSSLGGVGLAQVVGIALEVIGQVNGLPYGELTVAQALQALNAQVTVPASLAALTLQDILPLLDVNVLGAAVVGVLETSGPALLGLLQSLASSVDVTAQQKAQLLEALDEAIDLTPFLGESFKLSELLVDLPDGQLDLAPLIQAASQFLLSADGQVALGLSLPEALGLTSAGGSRINNIEFGFALKDSQRIDTPTLSHDVLTLLDGGQETALLGTVSGKTLRFEMLEGQGLDRNNLLALLDGDPQSGVSPVLQFSLASLAGVVPGQTVPQNLQVGVDVQLTSERAGGLPLRASFDLELALTKTNNGLQMAVVAQPVDMDLWVGNRKLGTLTAVNLDADTVMLQSGDNATPQLSVKLDNLLTKAMDNWVSLQALDPAAAVTLVGGVLTQALQGASVLDVLKLAQSIVTLPTGLQDLQLDEFLALGRSVIDLPEGLPAPLQSLSMGDALGLALQIGQLPAGATLGALIALARDAVALPDRLQSATLGDLKAYVLAQLPNNSRAEDVMDRLEALARDVLGLDANVNVGSKTLTELITKLENDFGDLSLADAAGLSGALQSSLGGVGLAQVVGIALEVIGQVNGLPYGELTVAQALQALNAQVTVPASLAALTLQDILPLLDVNVLGAAVVGVLETSGPALLGLLQSLASSVDVTAQQKAQLLEALDEAIDLTPFLGESFKLSELLVDLPDGQLDLAPLIQAASQFLLSADGQVALGLSLPEALGLTSAGGSRINNIEFSFALDDTPQTSQSLSNVLDLRDLISERTLDLGELLTRIDYADASAQGPQGFLIQLPEGAQLEGVESALGSSVQRIELSDLLDESASQDLWLTFAGEPSSTAQMTLWAIDSRGALSEDLQIQMAQLLVA